MLCFFILKDVTLKTTRSREYVGDVCWTYKEVWFECVFASLKESKKQNCCPKSLFQLQKSNTFWLFDLNSNKFTYTCPRLKINILNESL